LRPAGRIGHGCAGLRAEQHKAKQNQGAWFEWTQVLNRPGCAKSTRVSLNMTDEALWGVNH
jgi:hypothetical protein